jgi:hypothetical protein
MFCRQVCNERVDFLRQLWLMHVKFTFDLREHGRIVETFLKKLPNAVTGLIQIVNLVGLQMDQDRTVFHLSAEYVVAWPQCGLTRGGDIELRARAPSSQ